MLYESSPRPAKRRAAFPSRLESAPRAAPSHPLLRASSVGALQARPTLYIAEPPMRYRRHAPARKSPAIAEAPTEQIELRVRARDDARWRRIMLLNRRVSAALGHESRDLRRVWLALEENLHEHWLEVALEHYLAGFKAGLVEASRGVPATPSTETRSTETRARLQARLEALVAELARLVAQLEPRDSSR